MKVRPVHSTYEKGQELANSASLKTNLKKSLIESLRGAKQKQNLVRNLEWAQLDERMAGRSRKAEHGSLLEKTPLELLFETTVEEVKDKRKAKKGMPALRGEEFSDFEKKAIMEEFLSKEEVKRKIYEIIFDSPEEGRLGYAALGAGKADPSKVKISYDDIM